MATTANTGVVSVGVEDFAAVRSRVCWGAIGSGVVVALGAQFLLTLLGSAIGFSVSGNTTTEQLSIAAVIWVVLSAGISLFIGGFVAAQATAGESKVEAGLYGLLVWSTLFAFVLFLTVSGMRVGLNALIGTATIGMNAAEVASRTTTQADWEAVARQSGIDPNLINDFKEKIKNAPANAREAVEDPIARARMDAAATKASELATKATWYALAGTLVSMLTAIAGGLVGSGPSFRLFAVRRTGFMNTTDGTRLDQPTILHNRMNTDTAARV